MGKSYSLRDEGFPTYKKIVTGRKWVGRVCKVPGGYLGIIGKAEFTAPTEGEAFEEVVARHLGYSSAAALRSKNARVRAANRATRAQAQEVVDGMLRGDFSAFDRAFGLTPKGDRK